MKYEKRNRLICSIVFSIYLLAASVAAQTQTVTYQGKLSDTGSPPTGTYQMEFRLFDATGTQIGSLITNNAVSVTTGVFTVNLNFGTSVFPGADRFLEISVRRNAGESFVTLNPRQQIASSPYSIRTLSAAQADDSAQLGGVPANQYLQTNGNGSGLTDLNASSITTGTLANARLGQIPTANIADSAVTSPKIAGGQVVKGVTVGGTTLTDNVTLAAGPNITITPAGNTLTIASAGGGVGGSGTVNTIPVWNGGTTLSNSQITESAAGVQLPTNVQLAPQPLGLTTQQVQFGTPNGETGMTLSRSSIFSGTPFALADIRYDGVALKLLNGDGAIPAESDGITIARSGRVGIGQRSDIYRLNVVGTTADNGAVNGTGSIIGVRGNGTSVGVEGVPAVVGGIGVRGASSDGTGTIGSTFRGLGVSGIAYDSGAIAIRGDGTSWFSGNTTPLSVANAGSGTGVGIGSSPGFGYIFAYDYSVNVARTLALNTSGGNVGIGTATPNQTLEVNGRARITSIPMGSGPIPMCFNAPGDLINCNTSSLRFKTNIHKYSDGLNILRNLNPISYNWKDGGAYDIGLGAEDVAKDAPFFALRNKEGVVEGVRYERLNMVLINAVKEQQAQISQQQRQVDQMLKLIEQQRKQIRGLAGRVRATNLRGGGRGRR